MEAKDKAKQIVNKFKLDPIKPLCIMHPEHIKQCALIAVDEILNLIEGFDLELTYNYYLEVKKEIQNL